MLKYTLLYIFWGPILFGLIYFEGYSPLFFLNDLQTDFTVILMTFWMEFLNFPLTMQGPDMFFENGTHLVLHYTCNAMASILLYTAAIISYPTDMNSKIRWLVGGYFSLVGLNLIRLVLVSYCVSIDPDSFDWTHNYVGRYGMGVLTLTIYFIFTKSVTTLRDTSTLK